MTGWRYVTVICLMSKTESTSLVLMLQQHQEETRVSLLPRGFSPPSRAGE